MAVVAFLWEATAAAVVVAALFGAVLDGDCGGNGVAVLHSVSVVVVAGNKGSGQW